MPSWLISLAKNWLLNKTSKAAAEQIREQDPAAAVALRLYREGAPFMDIVKAYAAATANTDDDQVVGDLMTKPFSEVLPRLAGPLGAVRIPDGDGDPTNDISVSEVLRRVVDKVLAEPE